MLDICPCTRVTIAHPNCSQSWYRLCGNFVPGSLTDHAANIITVYLRYNLSLLCLCVTVAVVLWNFTLVSPRPLHGAAQSRSLHLLAYIYIMISIAFVYYSLENFRTSRVAIVPKQKKSCEFISSLQNISRAF